MSESSSELYQAIILQHARQPFHFEKKEGAAVEIEAYNPYCGDQYRLFLEVEVGTIVGAHFHGYGCAVSKASCSVLTQQLEGKSLAEVQTLLAEFRAAMEGGDTEEAAYQALSVSRAHPGREQCATLSWDALEEWLTNVDS
ncbi:MAG: Fe-S cluster assembly sulfur transfer protein SufU [Bacteroidota bacterium]